MKKLAIIGAGRMACIFAKNAEEMGIETHCFAWKQGALAADKVDFFYPISIFEKDKILEKCVEIGIGGIVATTELTISIAAYVAEKMGLNGNPCRIADVITDKYRNRRITANIKDLYHPKFAEIASKQDIYALDFKFPLILKPTSKGGKRGVSVIYGEEDISKAFDYASRETDEGSKFILEEYIDGGREYSVESLSYKGRNFIIQVTEKESSGAPHCVELAHHQPADISYDMRMKIEAVLNEAITAIGIENGPCHTEIKIKDDKIYLIEFNARPGGDHIAYPLTELSTGYPYIKGIISVAFNEFESIDTSTFKKSYAGVVFITEQTKELKPLFDICQKYKWCYQKNEVNKELTSLLHNNGYETNYFIYYSDVSRPEFDLY